MELEELDKTIILDDILNIEELPIDSTEDTIDLSDIQNIDIDNL